MTSWCNRPKVTPLQMLLYTGGIFYFLFISTEFFQLLDDFIKFGFYAGIMLLSYLAGYSAIDSKRLAAQLSRIKRSTNLTEAEKDERCFELIDHVLFDIGQKYQKKKEVRKNENRK